MQKDVFLRSESAVRSYCRDFPAIFTNAKDAFVEDNTGKKYIDFFCGAGSLNYGHNQTDIKKALMCYLESDGIVNSLDCYTAAKYDFIEKFNHVILKEKYKDYKLQFCGPTGTNAVEAALKLARKVTQNSSVISFTNAFHGMTLGSLSVTGSRSKRQGAGLQLNNTVFMPYDGYFGAEIDTCDYIEKLIDDKSSGIDVPAAFILETLQAEGGINVASSAWLSKIANLAKKYGALLIIDDIQVGCGRLGKFFSFEDTGFKPDLVCLSKSLSGIGLPMSLLLIKSEYDIWQPGEHNGTFRGNNCAFVTATAALEFWKNATLMNQIQQHEETLKNSLTDIASSLNHHDIQVRGRGMIWGVDVQHSELAQAIRKSCFENGLILELCGNENQVIKLMPPLTIDGKVLNGGLKILQAAMEVNSLY